MGGTFSVPPDRKNPVKNIEKFLYFFVDFFRKRRIILSRMETNNFESNEDRSILSEITGHKMVVGAKQLRKALESGRASRVYLAGNADPAITEPIELMCQKYHIECAWVPSMLDLGNACGIEVGAAAAAAVD